MVSQIFGGPPEPRVDPALEEARRKEEERAAKLEADQKKREEEEEAARVAGLRGRRSLLSGSELGYEDTFG